MLANMVSLYKILFVPVSIYFAFVVNAYSHDLKNKRRNMINQSSLVFLPDFLRTRLNNMWTKPLTTFHAHHIQRFPLHVVSVDYIKSGYNDRNNKIKKSTKQKIKMDLIAAISNRSLQFQDDTSDSNDTSYEYEKYNEHFDYNKQNDHYKCNHYNKLEDHNKHDSHNEQNVHKNHENHYKHDNHDERNVHNVQYNHNTYDNLHKHDDHNKHDNHNEQDDCNKNESLYKCEDQNKHEDHNKNHSYNEQDDHDKNDNHN